MPAGPNGVVGRPFVKGQSGNPAGRRKDADISTMAREFTTEALEALVAALRSPKERVPAAVALLDRGWGKPKITIEGDVSLRSYVLRAPSPVESADEWLRQHAPSDSRGTPAIIDATVTTDEC
jgi:hypothetical protein